MSKLFDVAVRCTGSIDEFTPEMLTIVKQIGCASYDVAVSGGCDISVVVKDGVTLGKTVSFDNGDDAYSRKLSASATALATELEKALGGGGSPTLGDTRGSGPIVNGIIRLETKR